MVLFQGAFWSLIVAIVVAAIRIILIFIYRAPEGKQIIENLISMVSLFQKSIQVPPPRRHLNFRFNIDVVWNVVNSL